MPYCAIFQAKSYGIVVTVTVDSDRKRIFCYCYRYLLLYTIHFALLLGKKTSEAKSNAANAIHETIMFIPNSAPIRNESKAQAATHNA